MTPNHLRTNIERFRKAKGITFTEAVDEYAKLLPAEPRTVWRWLAGDRKISPMAQARVKALDESECKTAKM